MDASELPVRIGDVIAGKYRVERPLGRGGMGLVVLATHLALEEEVAIKFLRPAAAANPALAERFLREAKAGARIKSDHAIRVLDVAALDDGTPYIVMEYLDGIDLDAMLKQRGALPYGEAVGYVLQACEGIAAAHRLGIVHRDLKPSNLFIAQRPDGGPLVKLLDFGISKVPAKNSADDPSLTDTSSAPIGSPLYMSPEQMRGDRDLDHRTDIWSLGVILYEATTRRLPFAAETLPQVYANVLTAAPIPPSAHAPVSPPFDQVVLRCLEKEAARRYATISELEGALRSVMGATTAPGALTAPVLPARPSLVSAPSYRLPAHSGPLSAPPPLGSTTAGFSGVLGPLRKSSRWWFLAPAFGVAMIGIVLIVLAGRRAHPKAEAEAGATATAAAAAAAAPVASPGSSFVTASASEGSPAPSPASSSVTDREPAEPADREPVPSRAPIAAPPVRVAPRAGDAGARPVAPTRKPPSRAGFGGRD